MTACERSIQAGTMFASPASTTVSTSNGSTPPSCSELIEPEVYCASRMARGPSGARRAKSYRAEDVAVTRLLRAELGPGRLDERGIGEQLAGHLGNECRCEEGRLVGPGRRGRLAE